MYFTQRFDPKNPPSKERQLVAHLYPDCSAVVNSRSGQHYSMEAVAYLGGKHSRRAVHLLIDKDTRATWVHWVCLLCDTRRKKEDDECAVPPPTVELPLNGRINHNAGDAETLATHLYNWQFRSACDYLGGQPQHVQDLVRVLAMTCGEGGWNSGYMAYIVGAAVWSLIGSYDDGGEENRVEPEVIWNKESVDLWMTRRLG